MLQYLHMIGAAAACQGKGLILADCQRINVKGSSRYGDPETYLFRGTGITYHHIALAGIGSINGNGVASIYNGS